MILWRLMDNWNSSQIGFAFLDNKNLSMYVCTFEQLGLFFKYT